MQLLVAHAEALVVVVVQVVPINVVLVNLPGPATMYMIPFANMEARMTLSILTANMLLKWRV